MNARTLPELVRELPPDAQEIVRDLVEFLLAQPKKTGRTLRQDWVGALRAYRGQYASVDLQHRASDWRTSP